MEKYIIDEVNSNQRIDKYVRKMFPANSLSSIFKAFRQKNVKVNNRPVDQKYILKAQDVVMIYLERITGKDKIITAKEITFQVVYEDENVLIVSKPVGLSVQENKDSGGQSLAQEVLYYLQSKNEYDPVTHRAFTPAPVHRLDRDTSGLVVVAKNFISSQELSRLFLEKDKIGKYYLTLVYGTMDAKGEVNLSLKKSESENKVYVDINGQTALTRYSSINVTKEYSFVEVEIITGRTHQIRAHFAAIGHPVVGDNVYGEGKRNELFNCQYGYRYQFLHAYKLKILDISGRLSYLSNREFISHLPDDKKQITTQIFGK